MALPFVSIIIPVFKNLEEIKTCLAALEQQVYPNDDWEIIVVDNEPNVAVKDCVAQFPRVVYTIETIPTQFAARNTGIKQARGHLLAFTDADCIPDAHWLSEGVQMFVNTPNCGIVAGHIEVFPEQANDPNPVELFEMITALPQEELVQKLKFGATANIFTSKDIFEKVGLFDISLPSGGDLEWGKRVSGAGYQVVYAATAIVQHPARKNWSSLRKRTIRVMSGVYQITEKNYPQRSRLNRLRGLIRDIWRDWPNLGDIWAISSDPKINNQLRRVQVILVTLAVKWIRISEKIRLFLGGGVKTDYNRDLTALGIKSENI
jgi:glycosyltransferase involved in cell wall biosynthesis